MLKNKITILLLVAVTLSPTFSRADNLTPEEQNLQTNFQTVLSADQKQITDSDIARKEFDYLDYQIQTAQAKITADQNLMASDSRAISALKGSDPTKISDETKASIARLQADFDSRTAEMKSVQDQITALKTTQTGLLATLPDRNYLLNIYEQVQSDKNNLNSGLDGLANTNMGSSGNASLKKKLDKVDFVKMENAGNKATDAYMKAKYPDYQTFVTYRQTHGQDPIPTAPPVVVQPAATTTPTTTPTVAPPPPPPVPVAATTPTTTPTATPTATPPPTQEQMDAVCDRVYVELAQLIQSESKNTEILSDMIHLAAVKMAALTSGLPPSAQTIEAYAQKNKYTADQSTTFKNKLTTLYAGSTSDLDTVAKAAQGTSYFNKTIRFKNGDSSAYILYLAQDKANGFTSSDAAAVWAQGQIMKQAGLKVGTTAGNNMNFSTQVYQLTQKMEFSKVNPQHLSADKMDQNIKDKIQASVTAALSGSTADSKTLLQMIKDNKCLKTTDNTTTCDSTTTTLGSDSIEKIKNAIAEMAIKQEVKGLKDYKLSKPSFNPDGTFTVKVDASPLPDNTTRAPASP